MRCTVPHRVFSNAVTRYAYTAGKYPYYGVPAHIAINMIMAVAAGGTVAVMIAVGVQV